MEHTPMDYASYAEPDGEASTFICTECGDGFSRYPEFLNHMVTHGPLDLFSLDGSSNGFEVPREYVLHENGTLTLVDRSSVKPPSVKPPSVRPPSPTPPVRRPPSPTPKVREISPYRNARQSTLAAPTNLPRAKTSLPVKSSPCRCETCGKSFNGQQGLRQHQQYGNAERGFKCTLCCNVFESREELKKHLQEHSNQRFYCCGQCGKRFLKRESLNTHRTEQHRWLRQERKSEHDQENKERTYPCKKCNLCFFWLSDLQSHLISHSKRTSDLHTVDSSPDTKRQPQQDLKSHMPRQNMDKNIDLKNRIGNSVTLSGHIDDTSVNVKNRNGSVLSSFRHNDDTIDMKKLNGISGTSIRPYQCGLCGASFQHLKDLKQHHLSHQTDEDIEREKQESEATPDRHMFGVLHASAVQPPPAGKTKMKRGKGGSGAKLHPCKHCHRVFNHSSSLSRHMRYHKGTLHTCVFCGRHFPQRCDVRRHISMYHKSELEKKPGLKYMALHTKPVSGSQLNSDRLVVKRSRRRKRSSNAVEVDVDDEDQQSIADGEDSSGPKPRVNYKCRECGKRFGLLCVYQRHLRYHKREPMMTEKCPRCPARFRHSSALERHLENHPSQSAGETDMEGQTSPTGGSNQDPDVEYDNAEDQEDREDVEGEDNGALSQVLYECTECTETFSNLQRFLQHQSSHGSDNLGELKQ